AAGRSPGWSGPSCGLLGSAPLLRAPGSIADLHRPARAVPGLSALELHQSHPGSLAAGVVEGLEHDTVEIGPEALAVGFGLGGQADHVALGLAAPERGLDHSGLDAAHAHPLGRDRHVRWADAQDGEFVLALDREVAAREHEPAHEVGGVIDFAELGV